MAKLLALYNTPVDAVAFDKFYHATHVPIAKKVPGRRRYEVSDGRSAAVRVEGNLALCRRSPALISAAGCKKFDSCEITPRLA